MKKESKKPTFKLWEVIVISVISSLIMSLGTGYIAYRNINNGKQNTSNNKHLQEFVKSYNQILDNYYDNVNEEALIDAAIQGMLNYLGDPYTTYLNESSKSYLTSSLTGTYEGIGVLFTKNDNEEFEIINVYDDTPAKEAGILTGDIITKVNDESVAEKTSTELGTLIKESKKDTVKITIKRGEEELSFNVKRKTLYNPAVSSKVIEQNEKRVGYIALTKFSDTAYEQFNKELKKLESSNIDSLIIDVRNNTGGYLNEAKKIAELFIEKGKTIYSLENKNKTEITKDETEEQRSYKVGILINSGSASASEVLAAALKYSYGASLIGTKSYGKGKVQQTSNLSDGAMIKYTTARWLTPEGNCIDGVGLTPDVEKELPESTEEGQVVEDTQLNTAVEYLSN